MKKVFFSSLAFGMAPVFGSELIRKRLEPSSARRTCMPCRAWPHEEPSPFGTPSAYQVIASGGSVVSAKTVTTRYRSPTVTGE